MVPSLSLRLTFWPSTTSPTALMCGARSCSTAACDTCSLRKRSLRVRRIDTRSADVISFSPRTAPFFFWYTSSGASRVLRDTASGVFSSIDIDGMLPLIAISSLFAFAGLGLYTRFVKRSSFSLSLRQICWHSARIPSRSVSREYPSTSVLYFSSYTSPSPCLDFSWIVPSSKALARFAAASAATFSFFQFTFFSTSLNRLPLMRFKIMLSIVPLYSAVNAIVDTGLLACSNSTTVSSSEFFGRSLDETSPCSCHGLSSDAIWNISPSSLAICALILAIRFSCALAFSSGRHARSFSSASISACILPLLRCCCCCASLASCCGLPFAPAGRASSWSWSAPPLGPSSSPSSSRMCMSK
eukprot:comp21135_c0_seq1/m.44728 comp21135_c0_seq1/g.44728  ORF comp21135_c0_seq1/g.44728 comp21135_c0_seq1/m.44728 type:complete len:357 (-) comp21135_c0_seq1:547-1617(-)